MPSATDIARMQATVARTLPDVCLILRYSLGDDGRGGKKQVAQVITTMCRLSHVLDRKGDEAFAQTARPQGLFQVTVAAGTLVLATDHLVINFVSYKPTEATDLTSYLLSNRFRVERVTVQ